MKIRTDFVSNSSSSSFVLVGAILKFDKFIKQVKKAGWKCEEENNDFYEDETCDLWDIKDWIYDKTKGLIDIKGIGTDYDIEDVLVGTDPNNMKGTETLNNFKKKILKVLKTIGITVKLSNLNFISGGSDASGTTFIESHG